MTNLLWLLSIHFVGDFLCQSNWMATNKSKSWSALTAHVSAYTAAFGLLLIRRPDSPSLLQFLALTFALHFLTDAITSRITARLWFIQTWPNINPSSIHFDARKRHWFFVAIGADQLIHAFCLAWTWKVCGL